MVARLGLTEWNDLFLQVIAGEGIGTPGFQCTAGHQTEPQGAESGMQSSGTGTQQLCREGTVRLASL